MDESTKNSPCKACDEVDGVHLQAEVEHLRQHLAERDTHIVALEGEFIKCTARANELEEQLGTWREKYERLYDSHKRVQKLNQVLEDKLLQMVDKMKGEKSQLTKDIATLSVRLAESKHNYSMLQKENERYKNDMNLAIQLLQCKPDNFVSQKLDNLPVDTQARVSQYVMSKTSKPCSSAQSKCGNENDTFDASEYEFNISASLMSKILEDSIQDTVTKHCDTCTCSKSQSKPFCYNESYYTVATQTLLTGDLKKSVCINCDAEIKSVQSNLSIKSASSHAHKITTDKTLNCGLTGPMYVIPQPIGETYEEISEIVPEIKKNHIDHDHDKVNTVDKIVETAIPQPTPDSKQIKSNNINTEPATHHKLCDRTKTPISSKKSSIHSHCNDDLLIKEAHNVKDVKNKYEHVGDILNTRKNSQSSVSAISRSSSVAKSTVSTHKSNTQVGPGPRFCHLRMQAGSKNILLDNAEPDVPPVLYRRQSKCNENSLFKDLNDDVDNFINVEKNDDDDKNKVKNDNVVVETTLIDVHVDNNNKESNASVKSSSINPVLMNVSSSPLQPLKTHNYSNNNSENNNNTSQSIGSQPNTTDIDNLLNHLSGANAQNNNYSEKDLKTSKKETLTPTDKQDNIKIFNFDRYEQNKMSSQYGRSLRKMDISQLHSITTRISKDFPPGNNFSNLDIPLKSTLPAVVNVYPNLTQTHLKVNEGKKVFTNEQSTSSLSSDDSAALLQKQQLLRVAEWVEKNLEQQNNLNDPLEDEVSFNNRAARRDSKLNRLTETLNEIALNMPHPVSKFAKLYSKDNGNGNAWVHNNAHSNQDKIVKHAMANQNQKAVSNNVAKETIFPVESGDATVTEVGKGVASNCNKMTQEEYEFGKQLQESLRSNGDKEITPEDLARMEYNVKKFLLSGPQWVNPTSAGRSRRTSSKTETDV
ncbi:putative uncharacterized protein DDB_G0277255 isoform X1 [Ostrinia furnacalis]|uniref:putative uncharacterized protein DDB_G0277255 isoform X1 n=2 Tax=Ostrinia furnacalis TaxID=93504 RepID=UPI001039FC68|nr:putative uncharacterized protein DDB_G0277255 isoform X1 [Ostrinia furnacalis]